MCWLAFCASLCYLQASDKLFSSLDRAEDILSRQRYLTGDTLTEADIRLFVTLIRFDEVRLMRANNSYLTVLSIVVQSSLSSSPAALR